MALMMIMGLALLIYALAERQLCLVLEKSNEKIPDQKGKLTSMPTLRQVLNLRPIHQQIIRLMGLQVQKHYLVQT